MTHEHSHIPEEPEVPHPLLSHVIERNIRTITRLRLQTAHERQARPPCRCYYLLFGQYALCVHPYLLVWRLAPREHRLWGYRLLTPSTGS